MSLDSYIALKASVADWLGRTDLTLQIPDFITLCEAEIKRKLRRSSTRTTFAISAEAMTVPADMAALRSMSLSTGSAERDKPLRICTPEMLAERTARNAGATGRPTDVAVMAGKFVFAPVPDQTYTANIFYFTQLTPLSGSNASNTVLVEAPDAYLFGALLQAEPFLEHDARAPMWQSKFDSAIDQLNMVREEEEYTASLRAVRLPVSFG